MRRVVSCRQKVSSIMYDKILSLEDRWLVTEASFLRSYFPDHPNAYVCADEVREHDSESQSGLTVLGLVSDLFTRQRIEHHRDPMLCYDIPEQVVAWLGLHSELTAAGYVLVGDRDTTSVLAGYVQAAQALEVVVSDYDSVIERPQYMVEIAIMLQTLYLQIEEICRRVGLQATVPLKPKFDPEIAR